MSNNNTIYQDLNKFFKNHNSGNPQKEIEVSPSEILGTATSQEEFAKLRLQAQQKKFIASQIRKIGRTVEYRSIMHEAQRLPAYLDYSIMSRHEIIGRALEIYTEEALSPDKDGNIIQIKSSNRRVKEELENLFYNVMKIHSAAPIYLHQMIKDGDCIVHMDIDDKEGIRSFKQLPVMEIERIETDYMSRLSSARLEEGEVVFRWKANNIVDFKYWSIAHFRLMLDNSFEPYGTSILEKCRRLWKNMMLAEDAMLSMQLLRGVDRLVYYIEVGNMDPDDVDVYLDELASKFKRKIKVDKQTGNIDLKHNVLGLDQDLFIPKRGANDSSKVDKLEGSGQMDTTVVDHLMGRLVGALGVPLPYLSYKETVGEGRSLSMQDIRFSRTVMRVQQAFIQELNKIALVHLIAIGLEEELGSFSITMSAPSIQKQMLDLEFMAQKISLFTDATDFSSGIAAMSFTNAKREIFNWTDEQIQTDMNQQRLERAAIFELESTSDVIPVSGIFKDVDAIYGSTSTASSEGQDDDDDFDIGGGGSGGGGGFGGGIEGFDDEGISPDEGDEPQGDDTEDVDIENLGGDDEGETVEENYEQKLERLIKG